MVPEHAVQPEPTGLSVGQRLIAALVSMVTSAAAVLVLGTVSGGYMAGPISQYVALVMAPLFGLLALVLWMPLVERLYGPMEGMTPPQLGRVVRAGGAVIVLSALMATVLGIRDGGRPSSVLFGAFCGGGLAYAWMSYRMRGR